MHQLSAEQARDVGMALASAAQKRKSSPWVDAAFQAIKCIAITQATVHVDDVAQAISGWLPEPEHANAWGSVWRKALRHGLIARTGEVKGAGTSFPAHAHKHARAYPIYRSLIFPGNQS
jgi:hypothetical protein